jgi:hypothetical protein
MKPACPSIGRYSCLSQEIDHIKYLIQRHVIGNFLLDVSDNLENVWLTVVISVGTNADIDLAGVLVSLVSHSNPEDRVSRGSLDVGKDVGGGFVLCEIKNGRGVYLGEVRLDELESLHFCICLYF